MENEIISYNDTGYSDASAADLLPYFEKSCDTALSFFETTLNAGVGLFNSIGNFINAGAERRAETERQLAAHQYRLQIAEIKSEENKILARERTYQLAHEAEIEKQRTRQAQIENETAQLRILEQSKCLQKALDVALESYTRKLDFYRAQLKSCDDFFKPQIESMHQEIRKLEAKQDEAFGNTKQYVLIQKQIGRLTDYCDEVNAKYLKLQGELTTAVKLAQLEAPDATMFGLENQSQTTAYLE